MFLAPSLGASTFVCLGELSLCGPLVIVFNTVHFIQYWSRLYEVFRRRRFLRAPLGSTAENRIIRSFPSPSMLL